MRSLVNILIIAAIFFSAVLLQHCSSSEPIKIGMLAGVTGRLGKLGISGRDGAILAVEEQNKRGGIQGRQIVLHVIDDKQDAKTCRNGVKTLIGEKVVAIVGPMTSSMGMAAIPLINESKTVTISPTVSTDIVSGKDDYFFRIIPESTKAAEKTAVFAYEQKKMRNMLVVYDLSNKAYSEKWFHQFSDSFLQNEDTEIDGIGYHSKPAYDFLALAKDIGSREKVDGLVLVVGGIDAAMICQQLKKIGSHLPIWASEWSATSDVIEYGGDAVEGIEIFHSFNQNDQSESFLDFVMKFNKRFGYSPGFASAYAYNAVKVLSVALGEATSIEQLKSTLMENNPYQGVQHVIDFDQYGDADRQYTHLKINNGKFITL